MIPSLQRKTSAYCLLMEQYRIDMVCCTDDSTFQSELAEHIPVFKTSIAGTRLVGRMTVGKEHHLLC